MRIEKITIVIFATFLISLLVISSVGISQRAFGNDQLNSDAGEAMQGGVTITATSGAFQQEIKFDDGSTLVIAGIVTGGTGAIEVSGEGQITTSGNVVAGVTIWVPAPSAPVTEPEPQPPGGGQVGGGQPVSGGGSVPEPPTISCCDEGDGGEPDPPAINPRTDPESDSSFEEVVSVTCSSNSACNDGNILTKDVCVNSGSVNSYCTYTPIGSCNKNNRCESGETQLVCPSDCFTSVLMSSTETAPGERISFVVEFNDSQYVAGHDVKFDLKLLPEKIMWDATNGCSVGGVRLASSQWPGGAISQNGYFKATFVCTIPASIVSGTHTLDVTPTIY